MKKERLTIEDRILIEELIRMNYKLKDMAVISLCRLYCLNVEK